jgi:hypothetical protein
MSTPETWKTCVVLLITQRSQVQILPPLQDCSSGVLSDHGRGLLHASCKRDLGQAASIRGVFRSIMREQLARLARWLEVRGATAMVTVEQGDKSLSQARD